MRAFFSLLFIVSVNFVIGQDSTVVRSLDDVQISAARVYEDGVVKLSRKQFLTMAGSLEDPTRLLIKTPGISTANDQANSVIYHAMPAQYHQWSLYGARVLNPNHNSNAGTISDLPSTSAGGVNMLSGQVIGSLEFNANPSGKSLGSVAGMSDVKLRNPYKSGLTTNISLIGLEAGYDRVIGKDNIMLNYRYSTVGVLTGVLGLDFGGEVISYQDLTGKYSTNRKSGAYSFYFSAGANSTIKDPIDSLITEFKDLQQSDYKEQKVIAGANHKYENNKISVDNTINISNRSIDKSASVDNLTSTMTEYRNRATLLAINHRLTKKVKNWNVGYGIESWIDDQSLTKIYPSDSTDAPIERTIDRTALTIQPTLNLNGQLSSGFSFNAALGLSSYLSEENLLDVIGYVGLKYSQRSYSFDVSFSRAAQNITVEQALDGFSVANTVSNNLEIRAQYKTFGLSVYHHRLGNFPENNGAYGMISLTNLDNLPLQYFSNASQVESAQVSGFTAFLDHDLSGWNIASNVTIQNSTAEYIRGSDISSGRLPFDYGYIFNVRLNREWNINEDKSLGFSIAYHHRGGERQYDVSESQSKDWGYTISDYTSPPNIQLEDYQRLDLRIYYKPSKRSTVSIDIQNVLNRENDAFNYYEPLTQMVQLKRQLGMIPILSWRVDW